MLYWTLLIAALCAPPSWAQTLAPLLPSTPLAPMRSAAPLVGLVAPFGLSPPAPSLSLALAPALVLQAPAPVPSPAVSPTVEKLNGMSEQTQKVLEAAGDLSNASAETAGSVGASLDAVLRAEPLSVRPEVVAPASGGLFTALGALRDLRGTLERLVSDLSGRKATIEEASFSVFTGRGRVSGLALRDPANPLAEPSLRAFSVDFDLEVTSLLGKAVHFRRIEIAGLDLSVGESERIAAAARTAPPAKAQSPGRSARIDHLLLRQARVHLNGPWLKGTPPTFYLRDMEWGPVDIGADGKITVCGEHCTGS